MSIQSLTETLMYAPERVDGFRACLPPSSAHRLADFTTQLFLFDLRLQRLQRCANHAGFGRDPELSPKPLDLLLFSFRDCYCTHNVIPHEGYNVSYNR